MDKIIEFVDRDARWGDAEIPAFAVRKPRSTSQAIMGKNSEKMGQDIGS